MITPSDEDYQQTKRVKKGELALQSPFRELADWISANYRVQVLNIYDDTVRPNNRPRLNVVLESAEDAGKFRGPHNYSFDKTRQEEVRSHFAKLVSQQRDRRFSVEKLFVIFTAFEPVARQEANQRVSKREIDALKAKLSNPDLWEINNCFDQVTFFFYTDAQVEKAGARGLKSFYTKEYAQLVQRHDEFGYLKRRGVSVYFDSKENFDTNYESNWYYYYK